MCTSPNHEPSLAAAWGRRLAATLCAALASAAGCAVGPDFVRPDAPRTDHYVTGTDPGATAEAEGTAQRLDRGAQVVGDWWTLFGSAQLDEVMRQAATGSQSLKAAVASLRSSEANLRAGYGVFFPQVDASAAATRRRISLVEFGQQNAPATTFNLYTLSGTVSYVLDVFGGQRRTVEALRAQVDYQRYAVAAAYVTLTANVVNTVIARAAYAEQVRATQDIVREQQDQVAITEAQAEAGTVPWANALSLRTQLSALQATVPPLRQRVAQAGHLLATLSGHLPSEWAAPEVLFADLKLPASLPVSLPSELVHQRPDILAAEAALHQASADIGVATAALFPSITLSASLGGNDTTPGSVLSANGFFWSIAAGLTQPLFHGGALLEHRQAALDAYDQALASYRQTVLTAFAQVADALRALEHDAEALDAQARSMAEADEALRLTRANYEAGIANYLQVLVAFGQYYQARLGFIAAAAQRLQDTVALFVALGGGWWDPVKSPLTEVPWSR